DAGSVACHHQALLFGAFQSQRRTERSGWSLPRNTDYPEDITASPHRSPAAECPVCFNKAVRAGELGVGELYRDVSAEAASVLTPHEEPLSRRTLAASSRVSMSSEVQPRPDDSPNTSGGSSDAEQREAPLPEQPGPEQRDQTQPKKKEAKISSKTAAKLSTSAKR
ncbi:Ubiquitin-conjugating enzyme E2 E2, partial [Takifugu flavidus]